MAPQRASRGYSMLEMCAVTCQHDLMQICSAKAETATLTVYGAALLIHINRAAVSSFMLLLSYVD